jgi:hypothetical protein
MTLSHYKKICPKTSGRFFGFGELWHDCFVNVTKFQDGRLRQSGSGIPPLFRLAQRRDGSAALADLDPTLIQANPT